MRTVRSATILGPRIFLPYIAELTIHKFFHRQAPESH
jgi:hypothetical protein